MHVSCSDVHSPNLSVCHVYCIRLRYEAHLDYFDPDDFQEQPDVIEDMDLYRRNRLATVFWYNHTHTKVRRFFPTENMMRVEIIGHLKPCMN